MKKTYFWILLSNFQNIYKNKSNKLGCVNFLLFIMFTIQNHVKILCNKFAKKMVIFEKDVTPMEITYLKKKNVTSLEIIL
jgi:hypothetical protein